MNIQERYDAEKNAWCADIKGWAKNELKRQDTLVRHWKNAGCRMTDTILDNADAFLSEFAGRNKDLKSIDGFLEEMNAKNINAKNMTAFIAVYEVISHPQQYPQQAEKVQQYLTQNYGKEWASQKDVGGAMQEWGRFRKDMKFTQTAHFQDPMSAEFTDGYRINAEERLNSAKEFRSAVDEIYNELRDTKKMFRKEPDDFRSFLDSVKQLRDCVSRTPDHFALFKSSQADGLFAQAKQDAQAYSNARANETKNDRELNRIWLADRVMKLPDYKDLGQMKDYREYNSKISLAQQKKEFIRGVKNADKKREANDMIPQWKAI